MIDQFSLKKNFLRQSVLLLLLLLLLHFGKENIGKGEKNLENIFMYFFAQVSAFRLH